MYSRDDIPRVARNDLHLSLARRNPHSKVILRTFYPDNFSKSDIAGLIDVQERS